MLPDYPEVKLRAEEFLMTWAQRSIPQMQPILERIGRFRQHEGREWAIHYADRSKEVRGYEEFTSEIELTREQQRELSLEGVMEIVAQVARDMAQQQHDHLMPQLLEVAEQQGGRVTGESGPPSKEDFLEALRKQNLRFDPETGELLGQILIVPNEEAVERMKKWEEDEDFMREHEKILEEKRREWRARENRRKLVD